MTATEELRRLLDERGVEWKDGGEGLTIIPVQDGVPKAWTVNTWPSGKDMGDCLWVQNRHPLTAEQAIEATLGSCNCSSNCTNGERTSDELLPCPFCGAKAEVFWQDNVCIWGFIEHKPDCWLAYDMPRHKQEIPRAEFAAWNRRAES